MVTPLGVARERPPETPSSARGIGAPSAGAAPIPRLGAQGGGELRAPVAQDRIAVGDEHALGTEVEQRLQRRNEAIAVPARALFAFEVVLPDPQAPARLDHGVAEGERLVRGDPERLLLAARAADRVRAHAGGKLALRRDRMEAGAHCESAGTRLVSPDCAAPAVLSAPPFGV